MTKETYSTVVIGAGQASLALAFYLKKIDEPFIILDEGKHIGDAWRLRWDSLRLFTPLQYVGLPPQVD